MNTTEISSDIAKYSDQFLAQTVEHAPKFILAILTLVIGFWVISRIVNSLEGGLKAKNMDPPLIHFLGNFARIGFKALLLVSVASMIGIETTSFVAVFGAAGLAVGLALQGSLANFAGGVLILLFKPYKVGDLIEAQGHLGVVKEIQIFNTVLTSPQNKRIIVPNGALSNGSITNIKAEGTLRVDLVFGVSYDADIKKTKEVLEGLLAADDRILAEPSYTVAVSELADSSVNFIVRPFVNVDDYWGVYFDLTEKAKISLEDAGISIPYPQRDVHLINHNAS